MPQPTTRGWSSCFALNYQLPFQLVFTVLWWRLFLSEFADDIQNHISHKPCDFLVHPFCWRLITAASCFLAFFDDCFLVKSMVWFINVIMPDSETDDVTTESWQHTNSSQRRRHNSGYNTIEHPSPLCRQLGLQRSFSCISVTWYPVLAASCC